MMSKDKKLKEGYKLAGCCSPEPNHSIKGYFSYTNMIVVHKSTCGNLKRSEPDRIISLSWEEVLEKPEEKPGSEFFQLDKLDFAILQHHQTMGIDYSLMVARILHIESQLAFERHKKLKGMGLLKRVEKVMVRYRRNIVDNKWIKHRNHTYYQITPKGERYLDSFVSQKGRITKDDRGSQ
jgi:hypothetical protein